MENPTSTFKRKLDLSFEAVLTSEAKQIKEEKSASSQRAHNRRFPKPVKKRIISQGSSSMGSLLHDKNINITKSFVKDKTTVSVSEDTSFVKDKTTVSVSEDTRSTENRVGIFADVQHISDKTLSSLNTEVQSSAAVQHAQAAESVTSGTYATTKNMLISAGNINQHNQSQVNYSSSREAQHDLVLNLSNKTVPKSEDRSSAENSEGSVVLLSPHESKQDLFDENDCSVLDLRVNSNKTKLDIETHYDDIAHDVASTATNQSNFTRGHAQDISQHESSSASEKERTTDLSPPNICVSLPCTRLESDSVDLDLHPFQPLSESTNDGFETHENTEKVVDGSSSAATREDALRQLQDELTSLNEDSLLLSTPLFKRQTPRKRSGRTSSDEAAAKTTPSKAKPSKKAMKESLCKTLVKDKPSRNKGDGMKSPGRQSKAKQSKELARTRLTINKMANETKKISENKNVRAEEPGYSSSSNTQSPTSILKKTPPKLSNAKTKASMDSKCSEKSVTFSKITRRRRRGSGIGRRGRGVRLSLERVVAQHSKQSRGVMKSTNQSLDLDMSVDKSLDKSVDKAMDKSMDKSIDVMRAVNYDTEDSMVSDGEGKLAIMEDDGDENWEDEESSEEEKRNDAWDDEITRKSLKHRISRQNVRSIIHRIVTNEHVSAMFRRCLVDEGMADQVQEALFEPKMTRAKVKDVLQSGEFPKDWAMSPLKVLHKAPPKENEWSQFLGSNLADESATREDGDSDYDPEQDTELPESDDDESVMSSHVSDFGSPLSQSASRTNTPLGTTATKALFRSPQSPAPSENTNDELEPGYLTRSRRPLHDKDIDELESKLFFHAPDIEPDIYNTDVEEDYADFLKILYKGKDLNETNEDDNNDAEFDYLGEEAQHIQAAGDESSDDEEYRFDLETKIAKTELNSLLDELFEEYGGGGVVMEDEDTLPNGAEQSQNQPGAPGPSGNSMKSPNTPWSTTTGGGQFSSVTQSGTISNNAFTAATTADDVDEGYPGHMAPLSYDPSHAALLMTDLIKISHEADVTQGKAPVVMVMTMLDKLRLQQQMCQYVQLLSQSYVQGYGSPHHQNLVEQSRGYLTELNIFGMRSNDSGVEQSVYHPPNLQAAVVLCNSPLVTDTPEMEQELAEEMYSNKLIPKREAYDKYNLTYGQMHAFMTSKAFVYPHIIPDKAFCRYPNHFPLKRVHFTKSEDMLLAVSLHNLTGVSHTKKYEIIQQWLMPTKTRLQLVQRVKHLKAGHITDSHHVSQILKGLASATVKPDIKELEEPITLMPIYCKAKQSLPNWFDVFMKITETHKESEFQKMEKEFGKTQHQNLKPKADGTVATHQSIRSLKFEGEKAKGKSGMKNLHIFRQYGQYVRTPSPPNLLPRITSQTKQTTTPTKPANSMVIVLPQGSTPVVTNTPLTAREKPLILKSVSTAKENTPPRQAKYPRNYSRAKKQAPTPGITTTSKLDTKTLVALANLYSGGYAPSPGTFQIVAAPAFLPATTTATVSTVSAATDITSTNAVSATSLPPPVTVQRRSGGAGFNLVPLTRAQASPSNQPTTPSVATTSIPSSQERAPAKPSKSTRKKRNANEPSNKAINIKELLSQSPSPPSQETSELAANTSAISVTASVQVSSEQKTPRPSTSGSLIGSAMAEVIGVSPSKLGTPDGLCAIGISPAKIPALSAQMQKGVEKVEVVSEARRSLTAAYARIDDTTQNVPAKTTTERESVVSLEKQFVDPKISPTPFANASLLEHTTETPSFSRLSPVSNPANENSMGFDGSSMGPHDVLVTPKKIDFREDSSLVKTPQQILENKLKRYGESPAAKSFVRALDTPTKRAVFMIEELASLTSSESGTALSNTEQTTVGTEVKASTRSTLSTPVNTRQFMGIMEHTTNEPGADHHDVVSMTSQKDNSSLTPDRSQGVFDVRVSDRVRTEVLSITAASGLASIREQSQSHRQPTLASASAGMSPANRNTSPTKCRPILPLGVVTPPRKSPILGNPSRAGTKRRPSITHSMTKQSPRRIAPKGHFAAIYQSPTKTVAAAITAKAKQYLSPQKGLGTRASGRYRPIAPKSPVVSNVVEMPTSSSKRRIFSPPPLSEAQREEKDMDIVEMDSSDEEVEQAKVRTRRQHHLRKRRRLNTESSLPDDQAEKPLPSDDVMEVKVENEASRGEASRVEGGEDADSQDEVDYARLMEASSTIRYDPRAQESGQQKSKGQIKKDSMIEMLSSDLIENDPQTDERDTAYAQQYMTKVRDTFRNDEQKFTQFLHLLHEFGKNKNSPVQLYNDISLLFEGHAELIDDFAAFLLPSQARECGCFMLLQEYLKARTFLRKLEVHFKKLPGMLQRVLTACGKWETLPTKNVKDLQAEIRPLLKGQQYLLDEFSTFFGDASVPESHMTDFEEVRIPASSDEEVDSCEEFTLPDEKDNNYGTRSCPCECHDDVTKVDYHKRSRHCMSCGIKVIRGRMYLSVDDKLRPLQVKLRKAEEPGKESAEGAETQAVGQLELSLSDMDDEDGELAENATKGEEADVTDNDTAADNHSVTEDEDLADTDIADNDENEDDDDNEAEDADENVAENDDENGDVDDDDENVADDEAGDDDDDDMDENGVHDDDDGLLRSKAVGERSQDVSDDDEDEEASDEDGEDSESRDVLDEESDASQALDVDDDSCSEADTLGSRYGDTSGVDSPMPRDDASQRSDSPSVFSVASSTHPPHLGSPGPSVPLCESVQTESKGSVREECSSSVKDATDVKDSEKTGPKKSTKSSTNRRDSPKRSTRPRRVAFTTLQTNVTSIASGSKFGEFNIGEFISKQKTILRGRSQVELNDNGEGNSQKSEQTDQVETTTSHSSSIHKTIVSKVEKSETPSSTSLNVQVTHTDKLSFHDTVSNSSTQISPSRKLRSSKSELSPVRKTAQQSTSVSPGPLTEHSLFGTISNSTVCEEGTSSHTISASAITSSEKQIKYNEQTNVCSKNPASENSNNSNNISPVYLKQTSDTRQSRKTRKYVTS